MIGFCLLAWKRVNEHMGFFQYAPYDQRSSVGPQCACRHCAVYRELMGHATAIGMRMGAPLETPRETQS